MYTYPRSSPGLVPRPASPRSGNQREQVSDKSSDFESVPHGGRMSGDGSGLRPGAAGDKSADYDKDIIKLKQITQRFFTKAALTIISSRVQLPQAYHNKTKELRTNKWFNLVLDESEQLAEEVSEWATVDVTAYQPNPLIIEVYLDTNDLARNQTLIVVDDRAKKWDVCKALDLAGGSGKARARDGPKSEIILERWKISVGEPSLGSTFAESPPNVYKKAVVLFRALYSYLHLMPAWKLGQRIAKEPSTLTSLRLQCRILNADARGRDTLSMPLYPSGEEIIHSHTFPTTRCPTGSMNIQVTYRVNCSFRLDDTDAALSSQFMGMDHQYFRPSLKDDEVGEVPYWVGRKDSGSLPSDKKWVKNMPDPLQAYGSLSTYHNAGVATGTSPLSALRAARNVTSETPPDRQSPQPQHDRRPSQSSRSSLRSTDGALAAGRRVSISFQPFKAGSLSSSPGFGPALSGSHRSPGAASSDLSRGLNQVRNRTSLNALPQAALRAPPQASNEVAVGSPSPGTPAVKPPMTRFSSSFSNRRSRISSGSGGTSRNDEDNNSSVRGSQSSSNPPESGLLAEGGSGRSSGSARTDEDNIADFLKMLDAKRDLTSFGRVDESTRDVSGRRTTAALNKYARMRESNVLLSESMSSSMMNPPRSSTSSSRGPPMLVGNSVSTSSSPGKPISPHTPHYPAIPSRLSANATIEELEPPETREQGRSRRSRRGTSPGDDSGATTRRGNGNGSTPMDIPTSPQRYPIIRRSSSAAHRHRASDDLDEFGLRSSSLPIEERGELSLSELLALQQPDVHIDPAVAPHDPARTLAPPIFISHPQTSEAQSVSSTESQTSSRPVPSTSVNSIAPFRTRYTRGGGVRGSPSSLAGGSGSGESSRVGRYTASGSGSGSGRPMTADDDEPLVFTMSEIGAAAQGRRGGEEAGEGGNADEAVRRGGRRGGGGSMW